MCIRDRQQRAKRPPSSPNSAPKPVPASPDLPVKAAPPTQAAPERVRPSQERSPQARPPQSDTGAVPPQSTAASHPMSPDSSQLPTQRACRSEEVDTATPKVRSEPGATTVVPRATTSTKGRPAPAAHRPPSPERRCTNAGWRSTSPAETERSDSATSARGGCSRTANVSDSRTGLRNPGTTARTATDPRGDPAFDAPPLHLRFFLADGHRAGRLATPPACSGTNDWRVVRMVWRGDDRP